MLVMAVRMLPPAQYAISRDSKLLPRRPSIGAENPLIKSDAASLFNVEMWDLTTWCCLLASIDHMKVGLGTL